MNLWIDLDNSPHVHFFAPIIRCLEREGINHFITVRSFSQTEELARNYGLQFVTIGEHRARHFVVTRVAETVARASQLYYYAKKPGATAAVSHTSRAQLLASWGLRIPAMTLYDYEFISSSFSNRVSRKVMVPSAIPVQLLLEQGLRIDKLIAYPGFKEEVYVHDFVPQPDLISDLGLDPGRLIITLRPPQTWAHYHNQHSEVLFAELLRRLGREETAQILVLCRTDHQAEELRKKYKLGSAPFRLITKAIDGLNLMWYSDVIFSGGGTMVREAALLGLNAYSIFAGKLGAADATLERQGKLKMIRHVEEIERLQLTKRATSLMVPRSSTTKDFITEQIVRFARPTLPLTSSTVSHCEAPSRAR
jgi:predicted glycosyltransferase